MKRVYLDASVVIVRLFGQEREAKRYAYILRLFEAIDEDRIAAIISIYTLQEICLFCRDRLAVVNPAKVAWLALRELAQHDLTMAPLLTRMEKMVHSRTFKIRDASDQPHAICAYLHNCDAIVAYDDHFKDVDHIISYLRPEELLVHLDK
ncbi:MAG: PIN domain-containing protein [Anaerolineae bacterium]|nr:PIN domain-containing protein [Anaerolineae bacterium]